MKDSQLPELLAIVNGYFAADTSIERYCEVRDRLIRITKERSGRFFL